MGFRYLVLGAGRQGTAAGYDVGQFGQAEKIWMGDASLEQARMATERINGLADGSIAEAVLTDASDESSVHDFLEKNNVDVLIFDETTGFTAMEQGTGYHTAIIAAAISLGDIDPGVIELENAMTSTEFVKQAALRGFEVQLELCSVSEE
jgi:lysine 6-dehydrogenase